MVFERKLLQLGLLVGNFLELVQEPGIDVGHLRDLANGHALRERVADVLQALRMRRNQAFGQDARLDFFGADALAGLQRAHGLQQRLFEGAADGHDLADGLHLRTEGFVGAGKFLELPLGNLDDDVVERRLETGRRLARDVVGDFVERVADGELGGDFRDGKAGRLRRQSAEERETRGFISMTTMRPLCGIDGELDVGAAGLDANLADHGDGGIAHGLVFAIGECLRGGDGDGVARMHAHGIEVLDGADRR